MDTKIPDLFGGSGTGDAGEFPHRRYRIIYADPPWQYRDKATAGKRGADFKYPTMSVEELKKLPVATRADENCALFLWVTNPMLPVGLDVMSAWGFTYKTVAFNWVKRNKVSDSWFFGMGNYTRAGSELCLLGNKGKPKRVTSSVHQIVDTKIEAHSKKPDVVRDRIVQLLGDLPRIELFARRRVPGWDAWGNEV
jgi:N6-adenosine-specific RNA methylase IME4